MNLSCSAKGCSAPAAWSLLWNNPKIHAPERRKSWLACEEHRTSLAAFLMARGFLRDVEPAPEDGAGDGAGRCAGTPGRPGS
ncbi:MAG TPA: acetone carboxylase [Nocardioidaceae bacterium]|nr:acetone carboxylase [Nocardioidaceae bacterium]